MNETEIISVDRSSLPTEMLPMFKTHCRVTFADDDDYLKLCLQRSIDLFERHSGRTVFETQAFWGIERSALRLLTPLVPADTFSASDKDGNDVTADYEIKSGEWFQRVDGQPIEAGLMVTLTAGYLDMIDLPPSITDIAFRVGAHYYENRESVTAYSLSEVPQWMNDLLLSNWIPRA